MAQGTCSIEGCTNTGKIVRGWCSKHYARFQRYGDPLLLRPHIKLTICSVEGCDRGGQMCRGFCQFHYYRWQQHGDPLLGRSNRSRKEVLTFLTAAAYATTDDCIIMDDPHNAHPLTTLNGRTTPASRAVWIIANGDPGELLVLHKCCGGSGAYGCINIRHLYLGDHAQNARDKIAAGRTTKGQKVTRRSG